MENNLIKRTTNTNQRACCPVWNLARWSLLSLTTVLSIGCSSDGADMDDNDSTETIALMALSSVTTDYPRTDVVGGTVNYVYDSTGRLVSRMPQLTMQDQQGDFTTQLQYEGDLLVQVDEPRQSANYTADMGRIVSRTLTYKSGGEPRTTGYNYDESARLVQVTEGSFPFVRGCQPGPGSGNGDYSITWDDNRVVGIVSDAGDLSVGYSYNDAGILVSRSISSDCENGEDVERYSHDEAGRLVTIERESGLDGNRETEERSYNANGQLVSIAITDDEGVKVETSRHTYNANGKLETLSTLVNGDVMRVMSFEYTSDVCVEQLWTDPESAIIPESEARLNRASGLPVCAFFPSLR